MKNFSREEIKKISYTIFFTNKTIVIAIIIGIALSIASHKIISCIFLLLKLNYFS